MNLELFEDLELEIDFAGGLSVFLELFNLILTLEMNEYNL